MDLRTFIEAYNRTAENLPGLMREWADFDDELREFYASDIEALLDDRAACIDFARSRGLAVQVLNAIQGADCAFRELRAGLVALMGVDPLLHLGIPEGLIVAETMAFDYRGTSLAA